MWLAVFSLVGLALLALLTALLWGEALPVEAVPGIRSAGAVTEWLAPFARLAFQILGVLSVGLLVASAALIPSNRDLLSVPAARAASLASWVALTWAVTALGLMVLTLSETLALPLGQTLSVNVITSYITEISQGAAWLASAALAVFTALAARLADHPIGAWVALVLALVTLLPPAVTGHSASSGDHDLATSSLVVHIVGVALWVGGLVALWWYARTDGRVFPIATARFSTMTLWAFLAVGCSGVFNALLRVSSPTDLWSTGYGRLLLLKVLGFVVLGAFGWWHRQVSLKQIAEGDTRAFTRLALGEVAVMLSTIAVAVALSQTPPPPSGRSSSPSVAEILLGFPMPNAPSAETILLNWRADLSVIGLLVFAAVTYGRWVLRLGRRGDRWPIGKTLAWYSGLVILAFVLLSGLATYDRVAFSLHMTQHMVLGVLVPILLVLAAPISLAQRALPPAGRNNPTGLREWLLSALNSGFVRFPTHPVTAFVLFVSAPYLVYFSGLFELTMRQYWAHELMNMQLVLVGYLFFESLIGMDPIFYRASYSTRILTLFASVAMHTFLAVALMSRETIIAPTYYIALDRPWWTDLLTDQNTGSAFAWELGAVFALIALIVLLRGSQVATIGPAGRNGQQSNRDGDRELVEHNQMLRQPTTSTGQQE